MTALNRVQLIYKIMKIISLVGMIFCIIGAAGSLLGGVLLQAVPSLMSSEMTDMIIKEAELPAEADFGKLGIALIAEALFIAAEAVVLFFQHIYYKHEMSDGTPFTRQGVSELRRVGILTMAISFGGSVVTEMITSIAKASSYISNDVSGTFTFGLLLFVLSFIFEYAVELLEERSTAETETASDSDTYHHTESI